MRNLTGPRAPLFWIMLIGLAGYLFLGWCGPAPRRHSKGKEQIARIQIKELEGALTLYRFDLQRLPTTGEGLAALVLNPDKSVRWRGPYLHKTEIPKDPWGRPYHYRCPGLHGEYDLFSCGPDGIEGGSGDNADIASWEIDRLSKR